MKTETILKGSPRTETCFKNYLHQLNYVWSGSGVYASVYVNRTHKRAIKVGTDDSDPYLVFAKAVMGLAKNRKKLNPYLPRIYNITLKPFGYVVEMEMLQALWGPYRKPAEELMATIERVLGFHESYPRSISTFILTLDPKILEVAAIIGTSLTHKKRSEIDLHNDNIMLRNRQLVITDPLCESYD